MKFPRKSILLSLILVIIGVVHIITGFINHDFQWLWIVLCFAAAAGNLLAEKYLTSDQS